MKRYGEDFDISNDKELFDTITSYMDDAIREDLHQEIAPCKPEEFLRVYVERDPQFVELLGSEFNIEM